MAAETQYTANTGMIRISTANSNLDGSTGTYYDVLTAASNGTLIKTITIKAQGTVSEGMVRLFTYDGSNTKILAEVHIPNAVADATAPAFETIIPVDYFLEAGGKLKASTQNGNLFIVIAEGLDWAYYTTSIRPDSTYYTANTGMATISTANTNRDGTGTMGTVLTAASNGTLIQSVTVKAQGTVTQGTVRLFLDNGSTVRLLTEIAINGTAQSSIANSFSARYDFNGKGFSLAAGWILKAGTENAETFNVIAEGLDWEYPS